MAILSLRLIQTLKSPKGRREHGLFLVEGPKMVSELSSLGLWAEEILVDQEKVSALQKDHPETNYPTTWRVVETASFGKISDTVHGQGIVAIVRIPDEVPARPCPTVIFNGVQDPGNVGTIIRSAVALGVTQFALDSQTADPYAPKTIRASAGAVLRSQIRRETDLAKEITLLKSLGVRIVLLKPGESTRLDQVSFGKSFGLMLGSEGKGICPALEDLADVRACVPMKRMESLNVSAAAAMALYAATAPTGRT